MITPIKNIKISITDFPKFSGKAKDWLIFERKFTSVAATQGYSYILASEEFKPSNDDEQAIYSEDKAYIYNAFKLNWAEASNYHLVEQHADTKMVDRFRCLQSNTSEEKISKKKVLQSSNKINLKTK